MPSKRRRTQFNYRSIARCNYTNRVIRFSNAETQTSPSAVDKQLYVALEQLDDRALPTNSRDNTYDAPRQDLTEDQRASSIILGATENADSRRNYFQLTLETSQKNEACDSLVEVNREDEEVLRDSENRQLQLDSCDVSSEELVLNDFKLQRTPPVPEAINPSIEHSIPLSSESSVPSREGSQTNEENDLENKVILRNSLLSIAEENISQVNRTYLNNAPIHISSANPSVSSSSTSSSAQDEEEDEDNEMVNDRRRENKKQKKYIRIKAQTVHIHNHFYNN